MVEREKMVCIRFLETSRCFSKFCLIVRQCHKLFDLQKFVIMSIIFRDPFFDGFDDLLVSTYPRQNDLDSWFDDGIRRDVITPFSGFGRMDMKENEKEYEMSVDLPGMDKSEIKMHVEDNGLVIEGERKVRRRRRRTSVISVSGTSVLSIVKFLFRRMRMWMVSMRRMKMEY